jgi:L-alanine-DL-glutamate epimerase-like enolase superfamily enzyme
MKIKEIRMLPLAQERPAWTPGCVPGDNVHTLVEVITDQGVTGIGSVYTSGKLVDGSLDVLRPMLVGELAIEPRRVSEKLHQSTFWQGRGGAITHTISGIDIALWDIFGKVTGQPVSRLLGGRYRERIKPYGSLSMSRPNWIEQIRENVAGGFRAIKIGWGGFGRISPKVDEETVAAAREAAGPNVELIVDAGASGRYWPHGYKWALNAAKMLHRYDVAWFEEPLRPDDLEGYAKLTEHAPLPISGCEVLTRRQAFKPWIEARAVDYIQPDVTKVGGLTEAYHIAMQAYDQAILTVPHGWNTAVGLVADLHLVAAIPEARWVEYLTPTPLIEDLVETPFKLDDDGCLAIPNRPGLGVTWNPEGIQKHSGMSLTPSDL